MASKRPDKNKHISVLAQFQGGMGKEERGKSGGGRLMERFTLGGESGYNFSGSENSKKSTRMDIKRLNIVWIKHISGLDSNIIGKGRVGGTHISASDNEEGKQGPSEIREPPMNGGLPSPV